MAEPGLKFTSLLSHRVTCTHIHTPHSLPRDCYTQSHECTHRHKQPFPPTSPAGLYTCTHGIAHVHSLHAHGHMWSHTAHTHLHSSHMILSLIYLLTHTYLHTHVLSLPHSHAPPSCCRRDELTLIRDPAQLRLDPGVGATR